MRLSHKLQIRQCTFEIEILQGSASVKFPCNFFIQWKTSTGKHSVASSNRHKAVNGKILFNEKLQLTTHMIFDLNSQLYGKKQSIIMLNLVSNSRPNDPKLVGRVVVQLSKVANSTTYQDFMLYNLEYCSVEGAITFKIRLKVEIKTDISPSELQRFELSEFQIAGSPKGNSRVEVKDQTRSVGGFKVNKPAKQIAKDLPATTRLSESKFQERLNKLKAETEQLKNSKLIEGVNMKYKSQILQPQIPKNQSNTSKQTKANDITQKIQMPVLQKEAIQFNSGKSLQNQQQIKKSIHVTKNLLKESNNFKNKFIKQEKQINSIHDGSAQLKNISLIQKQLNKKIIKLQQQLKYKNSTIESLNNENKCLKQQQGIQKNAYQALNLRLQDQVNQNLQKSNQKQQLQYEILTLKQDIANIQQYKDRIYLLQSQNKELQQQLNNISNIKTSQIQEYKNQQQLQQYRKQLQYLNEVLNEKDNKIKQLLAERKNIKLDMQSEIKDITLLQDKGNDPSQLDSIKHLLETQSIKHKNTQFQLQDLRQWFSQLQNNHQILKDENSNLRAQLEEVKKNLTNHLDAPITNIPKEIQKQSGQAQVKEIQYKLTMLNEQLIQKQEELNSIKQLLQAYKAKQIILLQQNAALKSQISQKQSQISNLLNQLSQLKDNKASKMNTEIYQYKKQIQTLQQAYLQQSQSINIFKQQIQNLKSIIQQLKKIKKDNEFNLKKKEQQIENQLKRFNDLIRRLKDKEEQIAKLQREKQNGELIIKQNNFVVEQNKQKIKKIENQKIFQMQKNKQLQKNYNNSRQNNIKYQKQIQILLKQMTTLKQNLKKQTNHKQQLQKNINKAEQLKQKDEKIAFLQQKIIHIQQQFLRQNQNQKYYIQRQSILKQNLQVVQFQSQKIQLILKQKQQNQQKLIQNIIILSKDINYLKNKIDQLQKQLSIQYQRNQGLQIQLQLLNSYQDLQNKTQIEEINIKLIQKNKQLLVQLQQKNKLIVSKQQQFISFKQNQMKQMISQSRLKKQKQYYQLQQQSLKNQLQQLSQKNHQQFQLISSLLQKQKQFIQKNNQLSSKLIQQISKNEQLIKQNQNNNELFKNKNQKYQKQIFQKIKNSNNSVITLQKHVDKLQKDKQQLQIKINKLKQDNKLLRQQTNQYIMEIKAYQNRIVEQQYKIKEFNMQITQISQFNHNKESQLQRLGEQIAHRQADLQRFNQQFNMKQFQLHMTKERVIQLQCIISQKDDDINQLNAQLSIKNNKEQQSPNKQIHLSIDNNKEGGSSRKQQQEITHMNEEQFEQTRIKLQAKIFQLQSQIQIMNEKQSLQQNEILSLNQQILTLKSTFKQQQQRFQLLQRDISLVKDSEYENSLALKELRQNQYKLNMNILQYKQNQINLSNQIIASQNIIKKLNQQLDNLKLNTIKQVNSQPNSPIHRFKQSPVSQELDIFNIVQEFKGILVKRRDHEDVENVLRLVIDSNSRNHEDMEKWNRQRGIIQEKAKLSSKQLQKLKSSIMKLPNRTIAQKSQLANLLKPTQLAINELIRLSETLSQMNLQEQPQEQFDQNIG